MIKYLARFKYQCEVVKFEIDRETDKCVFIDNQRMNKTTQYDQFFDTYKEARDRVIEEYTNKYLRAEGRLNYAKEQLNKANAIRES